MGQLRFFDIREIKERYNLDIFIETGTGLGDSLSYVYNFDFEELYSIELYKEVYDVVYEKFKNKLNIKIINKSSYDGLNDILSKLDKNKRILFWLDAHFHGSDFGYTTYGSEKDNKIRIPLEEEIKLISSYRKDCNDYFIIDDLRIYEDGDFQNGNWDDRKKFGGDGIDFIYDNLKDYNILKDYRNEGYIICIPKNNNNNNNNNK
jgi:hypothetical protein